MRSMLLWLGCLLVPFGGSATASAQTSADESPRVSPGEPDAAPLMVAVLAAPGVPLERRDEVRDAIIAHVTPIAEGRPVLPLRSAELTSRLAACVDAPCLGTQIAQSGAIGAVIARLSPSGANQSVEVRIDLLDPVSGAARHPTLIYSLGEGMRANSALAPLLRTLRPSMFPAPLPAPQLHVRVDVEGAILTLDDEELGTSPIAPREIEAGPHLLSARLSGYREARREIEARPGETLEIDLHLAPLPSIGDAQTSAETPWYEHWGFWTAVGGVVVVGAVVGIVLGITLAPSPHPQGLALPPIE